jgi:hypothetical protein
LAVGAVLLAGAAGLVRHPTIGEARTAASDAPARPSDSASASLAPAQVVERDAVPADLHDRWWYAVDYAPAEAGQVGTTALLALSPAETPIAAAEGLVATVENGELYSRDRTSTIRLRNIASGALVEEFATSLFVEHGAIADGYLLWVGADVAKDTADGQTVYPGGGLWAITTTPGAKALEVIPPEPALRPVPVSPFAEGERAPLKVSASGLTVASAVYLEGGVVGRTDVISMVDLTVRTTLTSYVYALTDEVALVATGNGSIGGVRLSDGALEWSVPLGATGAPVNGEPAIAVLAAVADQGSAFVEFTTGSGMDIVRVDLSTGKVRTVLSQGYPGQSQPLLYLAPSLSSTSHLVLLPEIGLGPSLELAKGRVLGTVLDTTTESLLPATFVIGAP